MDPESARLEAVLHDWIAGLPAGFVAAGDTRAVHFGLDDVSMAAIDGRFERLALDLFAYQYARIAPYRAYCDALGRTPATVDTSLEVPPLPVEAFKRGRIAAFPTSAEVACFHTSGTTAGAAGILPLASLALYDLALERGFRHHVLPDRDTIRMLVLVAPAREAPHSSLAYMLERVRSHCGAPESAHFYRAGEVRWRELRVALEAAVRAAEPVCLLGTALGWMQVLDTAAHESFRVALPPGSRLFETGGTKGRHRDLAPGVLAGEVERVFGIPATHVVGEYGMTEMGSQLYTTSLRRVLFGLPADDGGWSYPAWVRPRLLDAERNRVVECPEASGVGLLAFHDLASAGSVAHLLTADLGRPALASFHLEGRCPQSELRGCGLVHESAAVRG